MPLLGVLVALLAWLLPRSPVGRNEPVVPAETRPPVAPLTRRPTRPLRESQPPLVFLTAVGSYDQGSIRIRTPHLMVEITDRSGSSAAGTRLNEVTLSTMMSQYVAWPPPQSILKVGERLAPGETTRFFFDVVAVANALREAGMGTAVDLRAKVRDGSVTTTSERFRFNPAIHR